jgi:hypothetical protein
VGAAQIGGVERGDFLLDQVLNRRMVIHPPGMCRSILLIFNVIFNAHRSTSQAREGNPYQGFSFGALACEEPLRAFRKRLTTEC